jgi:SOS-response transcriptional repressor LexA
MGLEAKDDIGIRVNLDTWSELSDIQRAVYRAAVVFWWAHGYPPTLRNLADLVERTPAAVQRHVQTLKEAGLLDLDSTAGRTLTITGATWSPPAGVVVESAEVVQ